MTVYTIAELLSRPAGVERPDKFLRSPSAPPFNADLLRRFVTFAHLPMEGASCALIWWLLHASDANADACRACHDAASALTEAELLAVSGTGRTEMKLDFEHVYTDQQRVWHAVEEPVLKHVSVAAQRGAIDLLFRCSGNCARSTLQCESSCR